MEEEKKMQSLICLGVWERKENGRLITCLVYYIN